MRVLFGTWLGTPGFPLSISLSNRLSLITHHTTLIIKYYETTTPSLILSYCFSLTFQFLLILSIFKGALQLTPLPPTRTHSPSGTNSYHNTLIPSSPTCKLITSTPHGVHLLKFSKPRHCKPVSANPSPFAARNRNQYAAKTAPNPPHDSLSGVGKPGLGRWVSLFAGLGFDFFLFSF